MIEKCKLTKLNLKEQITLTPDQMDQPSNNDIMLKLECDVIIYQISYKLKSYLDQWYWIRSSRRGYTMQDT